MKGSPKKKKRPYKNAIEELLEKPNTTETDNDINSSPYKKAKYQQNASQGILAKTLILKGKNEVEKRSLLPHNNNVHEDNDSEDDANYHTFEANLDEAPSDNETDRKFRGNSQIGEDMESARQGTKPSYDISQKVAKVLKCPKIRKLVKKKTCTQQHTSVYDSLETKRLMRSYHKYLTTAKPQDNNDQGSGDQRIVYHCTECEFECVKCQAFHEHMGTHGIDEVKNR